MKKRAMNLLCKKVLNIGGGFQEPAYLWKMLWLIMIVTPDFPPFALIHFLNTYCRFALDIQYKEVNHTFEKGKSLIVMCDLKDDNPRLKYNLPLRNIKYQ